MRQFVVGQGTRTRWLRAIVGGKTNSGKTHFASTWPKPLFISDATEGGADTLENMSLDPQQRELWWDAAVMPEVHEIENMMEMPQEVTHLLERKSNFPWQTVVIDSLSIYAQRVLRELRLADSKQDGRQRYGELADGLSALVARVHSLPAHIVWLCHVDDDMQLTVPGKASAALWAYMGYKWMTYVPPQVRPDAPVEYQLHLRPFLRADWLGGRSYINTPSPMVPSFKPLAELLGFADKPPSPALPGAPDGSLGPAAAMAPRSGVLPPRVRR